MNYEKKMSRKDFFNLGFLKGKEHVVKKIEEKVPRIGIRPPGAISEESFLITCTNCRKCADACPHHAIFFAESDALGIYVNTPFIDVYFQPCAMCTTFPCITACEAHALVKEDSIKIGMAEFVIDHCLVYQGQYCDYCSKTCPEEFNALQITENKMPLIDAEKCTGCGKCAFYCVSQTGKAIEIRPF